MADTIRALLVITISWIIVLYPAIIYYDATRKKIGKVKEKPGAFNFAAGGWATASLFPFVWWIAALAYCIKRRQLIADAKTNPVTVPRAKRMAVLLLLACAHFGMTYQFSVFPTSSEDDYQYKKAAFWSSLGF